MGATFSQVMAHPSPITHQGKLTAYSRVKVTSNPVRAVLHEGNIDMGEGKEKAHVPIDFVPNRLQTQQEAPTLGDIVLATFLGVFAIVSALSLQNFLNQLFESLLPEGATRMKLVLLFLQFLLLFSLLIFLAFVFAG